MIAHIAQPLHNDSFRLQISRQPSRRQIFGVPKKFLQSILHAAAGCLRAPFNSAAAHRLAGHAGTGIDIGCMHPLILIGNPSHFPLARAHIRCWHVLRRVDQVTLYQLIGKAPGDLL